MSISDLKDGFKRTLGSQHNEARIDSYVVAQFNEKFERVLERTKKLGEPSEIRPADLYVIAYKFLRSEQLDAYEFSCLGAAINIPISERENERIVSSPKLSVLLSLYGQQMSTGDLLIGTWWRLFQAYFNINMGYAQTIPDENKKQLRLFLNESYNKVNQSTTYAPDWLDALHSHKNILTADPCSRYAAGVLEGNRTEVDQMSTRVKIPDQSWFWHRLMLSVVEQATGKEDRAFKDSLPTLLGYINEYKGYRDLALQKILKRYQQCNNSERHEELCRYVIKREVWGSPEFKNSNASSKWHKVDDVIFRMVLSWVNKEKLRLFFEKLTERYETDKSRFKFWSRYEKQICDEGLVILVIGKDTVTKARSDKELKKVIGEKGTFAHLYDAVPALDAIIMQIRDKVIVEFTVTGNAGYVYSENTLPFSLSALRYSGSTGKKGLKAGLYQRPQPPRIMHNQGWEDRTRGILMQEGIFPDKR